MSASWKEVLALRDRLVAAINAVPTVEEKKAAVRTFRWQMHKEICESRGGSHPSKPCGWC